MGGASEILADQTNVSNRVHLQGKDVEEIFIGMCVFDFIIPGNEIQQFHAQHSLYDTHLRNLHFYNSA
jgi:lantibiotic modifying enzyme